MVNVKVLDDAYLIGKKVLFGNVATDDDYKKYIVLSKVADLEDIHGKSSVIKFPGEYDIKGVVIRAILAKDNTLNYFINFKTSKIAVIQNPAILEEDDIEAVDYWLYVNENVEQKIDQLELEGKKIRLDTANGLEIDVKDDSSTKEVDVKIESDGVVEVEVE